MNKEKMKLLKIMGLEGMGRSLKMNDAEMLKNKMIEIFQQKAKDNVKAAQKQRLTKQRKELMKNLRKNLINK